MTPSRSRSRALPLKHRLLGAPFLIVAMLAIFGLAVAACGNDDDDPVDDTPVDDVVDDTDDAVDDTDDAVVDDETERTLELAYVPGWDEGVAATFLWIHILEGEGYDVNLTALEVPALFAGIAGSDLDIYLDAWLPGTHAEFMEEVGEDVVELQEWHAPAGLYLTVPEYVDAESLEDLADMGDVFNEQIIGIEPGAGMMGIARDEVMPTYGIEDWELVESSTPAMLSELGSAIDNEEPIVVTLWSPGWWYGRWDLRNLEDPENAWGDPDGLWVVTNTEFEENYPQLTGWLENFWLEEDELSALLDLIADVDENEIPERVEEWLEMDDHQETVDSWIE